VAFIGLTVTAFAQSQTIPIVNPAFDSVLLTCGPGPNCFEDGVLPGWAAGSPATTFATFEPSTGPGAIIPGGSHSFCVELSARLFTALEGA
jgi:hypothetical protein